MGARGPKPGDKGYRAPAPLADRIMARVVMSGSGCWLWQGPVNHKGYGLITVGSRLDGSHKTRSVHRAAFEEWIGPIPDGLTLDHLCEVKSCCNPDHLEPVTNAENMRRRGARQTHCARGHERTAESTRVETSGSRRCLACERAKTAAVAA